MICGYHNQGNPSLIYRLQFSIFEGTGGKKVFKFVGRVRDGRLYGHCQWPIEFKNFENNSGKYAFLRGILRKMLKIKQKTA